MQKKIFSFFKVKLNFSKKRGNVRVGPDLSQSEIPEKVPKQLTRRIVLSQLNGFFDPAGLLVPFIMRGKIMMRLLWIGEMKNAGWDVLIPAVQQEEWVKFYKQVFDIEKLKFQRCVKPVNAVDEEPVLVVFCDGSESAYGACVYLRWRLKNGCFESRLVVAKGKITPVRTMTIVRIELSGAIVGKRLKVFLESEGRIKFRRVYFLVDSEIVLAMIQRQSYGFNTYASVRIGEIQQSTNPGDWYWLDGRSNVADWITRGKDTHDLGEGTVWQKGPKFLEQEEKDWPIRQDCKVLEIPEMIRVVMKCVANTTHTLADIINISRYSKYLRLIRVTARILALRKRNPGPSLKNIGIEPVKADYEEAVKFWIKDCQSGLREEEMKSKYARLAPRKTDQGVWAVGARMERWTEMS